MSDRPIRHLNQVELARRWSLSHRTLERWRWEGNGPRYLKVGGRVLYRLTDIEAYEVAQFRDPVGAGRASPTAPAAQRWVRP